MGRSMFPALRTQPGGAGTFEHHERPLLVHHVARLLRLSPRMVRHLAANGILKGFRRPDTPKIWRFWNSDVEQFLARRPARCQR